MKVFSFQKNIDAKPKLGAKLLSALGIFLFLGLLPAQALAVYNPSYIMPDSIFTNSGSMSLAAIQNFLASQGSFLANYTIPSDVLIGPNNTDLVGAGTQASQII